MSDVIVRSSAYDYAKCRDGWARSTGTLVRSYGGEEMECLLDAYAAVVAERDALQEELRKLMETANYNAALSISELRESMNVPKDQPIRGRCANCHEWHPIADMWAECTPCFDETVAKQAKAERDALAVGERLLRRRGA